MRRKEALTRRQFIKESTLAAAGSAIFLARPGVIQTGPADEEKKSKIVLVRNKEVLDQNSRPKTEVVLEMLDAAVRELTGKPEATAAWKSIIKPEDIVGIKTNVWTYIPTTTQVENALKRRV
ncbi:MAG: twin-arginine translocation signal domain-containing protein, partial [Acidobacteriota bacterium]